MPHLLVAGTTGSGKSVCINTIICSILYKSSPQEVKFVMIDPKMVELNVYNGIPHLAAPVVTDPKKAAAVLNNVVKEMEARYKLLSECGVRNIESYGKHIKSHPELQLAPMPYMVVIVDEFGDLMMVAGKEVEAAIIRIAQLARAVGIHLVLATQRPSVNVITGIIKANMPARISFRVSSKIDSRTILDQNGAELLLGRGDSLFIPPGTSFTTRIHGCFVSEDEVKNIVEDLKRYGEPDYNMQLLEEPTVAGAAGDEALDSRFDEAVQIAKEKGEASISMIQRYLRIGYNRAARIVESMEQQGLIAASDGTSKPRKFLG
jgi:S-DNA-T family DNA segregation ATPase FtsK/SpoIIIE